MNARIPLYVFGAGGHGKVVAEAARAAGDLEVRGFLDDDFAIGAVVLPGLSVGAWSTLGAGAVLTRSLPSGLVATGIPARGRVALERAG